MSAVDIPLHDPTQGALWNYVVQILYNPILALVKSSLLLLLLRLFGRKPGVRRFIIWVNTLNLASMASIFFAVVFQCFPFQKAWKPRLEGFCVDRRILFVATSAINIVLDLLILGLPLRIFIGLQVPRRTKIALMMVFLLGFLYVIVSLSFFSTSDPLCLPVPFIGHHPHNCGYGGPPSHPHICSHATHPTERRW